MNAMIYESRLDTPKILDEGYYKGYAYMIISYGTHPCAYVQVYEEDKVYADCDRNRYIKSNPMSCIECHGGITFASKSGYKCANGSIERKGRWLGWDYNHLGDYSTATMIYGWKNDKKLTTEEIYKEVINVINQIIKMNKEYEE